MSENFCQLVGRDLSGYLFQALQVNRPDWGLELAGPWPGPNGTMVLLTTSKGLTPDEEGDLRGYVEAFLQGWESGRAFSPRKAGKAKGRGEQGVREPGVLQQKLLAIFSPGEDLSPKEVKERADIPDEVKIFGALKGLVEGGRLVNPAPGKYRLYEPEPQPEPEQEKPARKRKGK